MISVQDAQALICNCAAPSLSTPVALEDAYGRILAASIAATRDQPPFDASAMDGFAFASAAEPKDYRIIGESAAGHPFRGVLGPNDAIRISTGAALPIGADTVLIQEDATIDEGILRAAKSPLGANVRARGGDFRNDAVLLAPGRRLSPGDVMLAASAGRSEIQVRRQPRVTILGGGDEIVAPGATPRTSQIFESASFGVAALSRVWGGLPHRLPPFDDNIEAIQSSVAAALDACDVLVLIGGASVGPHDHARTALRQLNLEMLFEKVSIRPGKPTWFGRLGKTPVLGLPGNPASAMVCARLFLIPLIESFLSVSPPFASDTLTVQLGVPLPTNGPRAQYWRARLNQLPNAALCATRLSDQDSSLSRMLSNSQGLIVQRPHEASAPPGATALFMPWEPFALDAAMGPA